MKTKDVVIGDIYAARVSGRLQEVRVTGVGVDTRGKTFWHVSWEYRGGHYKSTRSAAALRSVMAPKHPWSFDNESQGTKRVDEV